MNVLKHKKIIKFFFLFFLIFLISSAYLYIKKTNDKTICGQIVSKKIDVFSLESAKVQKIFILENDFVKKNDLLIQFDTTVIDNKIKQIQASIEYEKTKENLLKFKEEKTLEDYLNYKKEKNHDLKIINTKLKVLESVQQLRNIQLKKIAKLEADLSFYSNKKQCFFIYSPCNGLIQNLDVFINQSIRANDKLLMILDSDNVWLEAKIKKSSKYKIGNNFSIFIENFPEAKYQGKIFYLSIDKNNHKKIDVKLSVNQLKMSPNETTYLLTNGMKAQFKYE